MTDTDKTIEDRLRRNGREAQNSLDEAYRYGTGVMQGGLLTALITMAELMPAAADLIHRQAERIEELEQQYEQAHSDVEMMREVGDEYARRLRRILEGRIAALEKVVEAARIWRDGTRRGDRSVVAAGAGMLAAELDALDATAGTTEEGK